LPTIESAADAAKAMAGVIAAVAAGDVAGRGGTGRAGHRRLRQGPRGLRDRGAPFGARGAGAIKALAKRISRLEGRHASDEFAGMTSAELRRLIKDRFERMAAKIGGYDVLAEAFRREGLDAAVEMIDRMRAAKEAGETECEPDEIGLRSPSTR
jgi:hypothetical protein